jgi:multidrug efflux pump subunit AcrA (membrane-fusion protein)
VNENEWVQQGQPLIEIVNDQVIRAKFLVPFEYHGKIRIGQIVNADIRGINRRVQCKITHISPVLEANTSTFQVFAEIDNSKDILRAGMIGEISLEFNEGN